MMLGTNPHSAAVAERIPHDSVGVELGVWKGDTAQVILNSGRVRLLHLVDAWSGDAYHGSDEHVAFGADGWQGYLNKYAELVGGRTAEAFQRHYDAVYAQVCDRFETQPVVIHRKTTADFLSGFREAVDWVYVDASHDYKDVRDDLEGSATILKAGGKILGDDYGNPSKPGVTRAVAEFAAARGLDLNNFLEDQFELCIPPA